MSDAHMKASPGTTTPVRPTETALPDPYRGSTVRVFAVLARRPGYRMLFTSLMLAAAVIYTFVLPSLHTMQFGPANWSMLTGNDVVFSLLLAAGLSTVLTLQVFTLHATASRRAAGGKAALGIVESVAAIVPSLCCTPVLPTVLAVFGVGAAGSASTMRAIAPYATAIWIGILVLMAATAWWSARRIAATDCPAPGQC